MTAISSDSYTTLLDTTEGRPSARLLIVTGQPDQNLHRDVQVLADKEKVKTQWLLYRVNIELTEAP